MNPYLQQLYNQTYDNTFTKAAAKAEMTPGGFEGDLPASWGKGEAEDMGRYLEAVGLPLSYLASYAGNSKNPVASDKSWQQIMAETGLSMEDAMRVEAGLSPLNKLLSTNLANYRYLPTADLQLLLANKDKLKYEQGTTVEELLARRQMVDQARERAARLQEGNNIRLRNKAEAKRIADAQAQHDALIASAESKARMRNPELAAASARRSGKNIPERSPMGPALKPAVGPMFEEGPLQPVEFSATPRTTVGAGLPATSPFSADEEKAMADRDESAKNRAKIMDEISSGWRTPEIAAKEEAAKKIQAEQEAEGIRQYEKAKKQLEKDKADAAAAASPAFGNTIWSPLTNAALAGIGGYTLGGLGVDEEDTAGMSDEEIDELKSRKRRNTAIGSSLGSLAATLGSQYFAGKNPNINLINALAGGAGAIGGGILGNRV